MSNWFSQHRIPILFTIVSVTLSLLILFQVHWLMTAQKMIEEQFDQKVNLALGNALTHHNTKFSKDLSLDDFNSCSDWKECYYYGDKSYSISVQERDDLEQTLSNSMACFGIDEDYDVALVSRDSKQKRNSYSCSIDPLNAPEEELQLCVSFPCKEKYVFDKMIFMILSAILISLLLAAVSFYILKALVQQKRITENNIDIFNNAAHELKTPLTNISLALNLFQRKNPDFKQEKYLQIVERENAKLTNQIERVLYLSKLENGDYTIQEEALDLKNIIKEAVLYMDIAREEKNGTIEMDFPPDPCMITGDRFHLSNICINLIENALKYCDETPQIKITLTALDNQYQLLFSDNGIGISKCDQEHIFKKFQRVNTGNVQNAKGFGIGLSYVKKALEMHRGLIKVKSELHKGSQFEISIPRN